jgi:hypothetical protein
VVGRERRTRLVELTRREQGLPERHLAFLVLRLERHELGDLLQAFDRRGAGVRAEISFDEVGMRGEPPSRLDDARSLALLPLMGEQRGGGSGGRRQPGIDPERVQGGLQRFLRVGAAKIERACREQRRLGAAHLARVHGAQPMIALERRQRRQPIARLALRHERRLMRPGQEHVELGRLRGMLVRSGAVTAAPRFDEEAAQAEAARLGDLRHAGESILGGRPVAVQLGRLRLEQ